MSDYDAIVIGGGHNGLTAAAILQRGGARTLLVEKNHYTGGMASTVELFPGFRFEIAGSVLFPISPTVIDDLGLDACPTMETEIMSVNIGGPDDEPMIFYSDPVQMLDHIAEKHGAEAMSGMAELHDVGRRSRPRPRALRGAHPAPFARRDVRRGPRRAAAAGRAGHALRQRG